LCAHTDEDKPVFRTKTRNFKDFPIDYTLFITIIVNNPENNGITFGLVLDYIVIGRLIFSYILVNMSLNNCFISSFMFDCGSVHRVSAFNRQN